MRSVRNGEEPVLVLSQLIVLGAGDQWLDKNSLLQTIIATSLGVSFTHPHSNCIIVKEVDLEGISSIERAA